MKDTFLDQKYISLLSPYLKQFRKKGENIWNFRCPLCGDSHKDTTKTRGYIYRRKQYYSFYCHNCNRSYRFSDFLKEISPSLYKDYLLETFVDKKEDVSKVEDFVCQPVFLTKDEPFKGIKTINDLPNNNPARQYITSRLIPKEKWKDIYFVENFKDFVDDLVPGNDKMLYPEPRIIFPFYDKDGVLLGIQGRAVGYSKVKYVTVKLSDNNAKVFGWNNLDTTKTIYVTEGPIDSLFLENSIASMDADLTRVVPIIGLDFDFVFVYDNEPRNKQIVSNMRKTIERGYKDCVWPNTFQYKDINEGVMDGISPSIIQRIIDQNTFDGLEATMKLNQWSKL
jgi:hypothetical protein